MKNKIKRMEGVFMVAAFLTSACGCGNSGKVPQLSAADLSTDQSFEAYQLWDFKGVDDGFHSSNGSEITTSESSLVYEQKDKEDSLQSPAGLSIPADTVQTVEIRIKTESAHSITLQWRQTGEDYADANQAQIELINDGEYHDYQIQLSTVDSWRDTVEQFSFKTESKTKIEVDYVRLTGLYLVPFPWLSFSYSRDMTLLNTIRNTFASENNSIVTGFSCILEYLNMVNEEGNFDTERLEYIMKLSSDSQMPVMIWLRADPWACFNSGAAVGLYAEDKNLMWTEELTSNPVYRYDMTGYYYMSLAQTDIYGEETPYWQATDKLLGQCAEKIAQVIEQYPGQILGVNTTSEYRFVTEGNKYFLDYNPNSILEFSKYCKGIYGTIDEFNKAAGTQFSTYELRSKDYNPSTVENEGGFDAPRDESEPDEFWDIFNDFRATQIHTAVTRLVNIISGHLDAKYIYTHQIAYDDRYTCSPITCGDVEGSNIGIDFFNHEANDKNLTAIQEMIGSDVSRSWGCPEWMIPTNQTYDDSYTALDNMVKAGVKYICPFNYGSNDDYDVQGAPSEQAIVDYIKKLDQKSNPLISAKLAVSKSIVDAQNLIDGSNATLCDSIGVNSGDRIRFTLEEEKKISSLTFVPASNINLMIGKIELYINGKIIGEYDFGADNTEPVTLLFDQMDVTEIEIKIVEPVKNSKGETEFAAAAIRAGRNTILDSP